MSEPAIKGQIIQRLLDLAAPLQTEGKVRLIARKRTLFLLEAVKPSLHLVVGDEVVIGEDERGYALQFPIAFKIILDENRDPYSKADELTAWLQEKIEGDAQLNGGDTATSLASKVTYDGELPFTEEALKPDGGTAVMYLVDYRRYRADPGRSY